MKIFNTMTRRKEELVPLEPGKIKLYVCGPTVYDYIHVGNARPICVFDTLRRYLEYRGYEVTFAQNVTDVDDKIIARANERGVSAAEHAAKYEAAFMEDAAALGSLPPTIQPRATETMGTILEIVGELERRGYAYAKGGDVYFRSRKFEDYGKLSHQPLEDLEAGSRIDVSAAKEDPLDFALWKSAKPGEPFWESPWGQGRPGWHIECSAMVKKHLGDTIDIHCGGQDLIFPHHENEIAQSECSNGAPYARYWMHNGHINVDNRKMSKSLGNFFTLREVAEKYGYEPVRFLMLSVHYRSPMNYSLDVLEQSKSALERLYTCRDNMDFALEGSSGGAGDEAFRAQTAKRREQFVQAMEDDLNTADAVAALFDLARDVNIHLAQPRDRVDIEAAAAVFDELCGVLGLLYNRKSQDLDSEIEALIEERQQARKNRDFARADEIRDGLRARGIVLEDTPQGVKYHIVEE